MLPAARTNTQGTRHRPLNRDRRFQRWAPFEPDRYLDMNPSFVRLSPDQAAVVFCRYQVPPEPGKGSIWRVPVDAALNPIGAPVPLIREGIDPRVIAIGNRLLVFYALIERDDRGAIDGSCVVLAEFALHGETWMPLGSFRLPKSPITGHVSAESSAKWEKNWIPFAIDDGHVGLIYAHDPWDVIVLDLHPTRGPSLQGLHRGASLAWDYGTIRGGTPPVRYDDSHLVTFFHAAQVIGSRRVYTVGACVFLATAPFTPVAQTREPLVMAPYGSMATRFGWKFAGSVVFPAGAAAIEGGYRLTCGLDDGEIATFDVTGKDLAARLDMIAPAPTGTLHRLRAGDNLRLPLEGLIYVPDPEAGIADPPIINFARALVGAGRTLVDIGAGAGDFTMALAPRFDRVVAFEPSRSRHRWLLRNVALNDYQAVRCHLAAAGEVSCRREGGSGIEHHDESAAVEALDDHGLADIDLMRIHQPGQQIAMLKGAARTLRACRPAILIQAGSDGAAREEIRTFMDGLDYGFEPVFPLSPGWVLCLPAEQRRRFRWFV